MFDALISTGHRVNVKSSSEKVTYVNRFQWKDNLALPIQVIKLPTDIFPEYPVVRRHWIIIGKDEITGKDKFGPPLDCTSGNKSTGGHCLTCWAKSQGLVNADPDRNSPSEEIVVPIFDHTLYRGEKGKFIPIAMNVRVSPDQEKKLTVGGLKIMYLTSGQFRKLLDEHDSIQNTCKGCGGHMFYEGMSCEECDASIFDSTQIASMTESQFSGARFDQYTCEVCKHTGFLKLCRKCSSCNGTEPKTLYDIVIAAERKKVATRDGSGTRSEYKFFRVEGRDTVDVDSTKLLEFLNKVYELVTTGPSIVKQAEQLGIEPPKEWLQQSKTSLRPTRPYAKL